MPPPTNTPGDDWWLDAVNRPLGAYYRVDPRSITDMHVALNEVGMLYASAVCHAGWLEGATAKARTGWTIPFAKAKASDGGHAFALVGYDRTGFLVQNSWGERWGDGGFATLTYEDWLEHAMDCWVAQLGVVTEEHRRVALSATPRGSGAAPPASRPTRCCAATSWPRTSSTSRTTASSRARAPSARTEADVTRTGHGLPRRGAPANGTSGPASAIDIAIYAHGGLTGERDAEATFARWLPALYAARMFPVFLMWESDLLSTIGNRLSDLVEMAPRPAGGPLESLSAAGGTSASRACWRRAGCALWDEMKQNAAAISGRAVFGRAAALPAPEAIRRWPRSIRCGCT